MIQAASWRGPDKTSDVVPFKAADTPNDGYREQQSGAFCNGSPLDPRRRGRTPPATYTRWLEPQVRLAQLRYRGRGCLPPKARLPRKTISPATFRGEGDRMAHLVLATAVTTTDCSRGVMICSFSNYLRNRANELVQSSPSFRVLPIGCLQVSVVAKA